MIYAYCGKLGMGKSYYQLWDALRIANKHKKDIVCNFPLDLDQLHEYCLKNGLYWVAARIRRGYFLFETEFNRMIEYDNVVLVVDEVGIYLDARSLANGKNYERYKKFFDGAKLSRKGGQDLCWVSQHHEMVDINLRRLTNVYHHCYNTNPRPGKDPFRRLVIAKFNAANYEMFLKDACFRNWFRFNSGFAVKRYDADIFKCYDTLYRHDGSVTIPIDVVARELAELDGEPKVSGFRPLYVPEGYQPGRGKHACS